MDININEARTLDNIKRVKLSASLAGTTSESDRSEGNENDGLSSKKDEDTSQLLQSVLESSPFLLDGDTSFGLFLRAKRDLKAGELLFDDTPAFFGPSADLVQDYTTPLCLGCCVVMNDGSENNRCPTCNWPICGADCDNLEHHKANECQLFVKHNVSFPPNVEIQPCYKAIAIIRGLLVKERDPAMWKQLMTLQWETQLQLTPFPDFTEFKENFGLGNFGDENDWERLLGIINVNSYSFQRVEKKDGSPSFGECLFPIYSLMCHSCTPNCTWAITYSPTFTMKVRPTVDIKKGEMLNVCYNHEFSKFGFHKRQEKIRERAEFNCKCQRCIDPTDLGTFAAAVTCFKCKEGYMLPLPMKDKVAALSKELEEEDDEEEEEWECDKCSYKMCSSFITAFAESLYEQSDMAEDEAEESGEPVVKIFENFIASTSSKKVHPNHWVISEASLAIIKLQSAKISEINYIEEVDKYIQLCQYLLKIRNVLAPGLSNERGMLHHSLARGLYRKLELSPQIGNGSEELHKFLRELHDIQQYAIKFWKENPHYETLIASYKREPEALITEANKITAKLKDIPKL